MEIGLVLLALVIWVGAIALFFNRWGKIRMLLPYQPDYKSEQLKVPGTGACASTEANYTHSSSQHACSQVIHHLYELSVVAMILIIQADGCAAASPKIESVKLELRLAFFSFIFDATTFFLQCSTLLYFSILDR